MKRLNIYILLLIVVAVSSCRKENTPEKQDDVFVKAATDTRLGDGSFTGASGHSTSGDAIYFERENDKLLRLENFKTDNGPLLKVYISKDEQAKEFVDLGDLKAVSGNQNYEIDKNLNLEDYKYVLIWCEKFSVLFGSTEVK